MRGLAVLQLLLSAENEGKLSPVGSAHQNHTDIRGYMSGASLTTPCHRPLW